MKRIMKLLLILIILSVIIQPVLAEPKEGIDYTCVDKGDVKSQPNSHRNIESIDEGQKPLCSDGKVPKSLYKDITKEENLPDIKSSEALPDIKSSDVSPEATFCTGGKCFDWVFSHQYVDNKGVFAYLTQHNPEIDPTYGIFSCTGIYTTDGSNRVNTGWCKYKGGVTRLETSWWKYNAFQCKNFECGWVQTSSYYYPGMPISSDGYSRPYEIYYDEADMAWWIIYNGYWLGYYPGYLWDYTFDTGTEAVYRGIVAGYAPTTTTDMGNGLWASNSYAASITGQEYLDADTEYWNYANTNIESTSPSLYSIVSTSPYSIRYGGPGKVGGITVISPNGGENWIKDTTKTITWTSSGNVGSYVKIELLKGGYVNQVISWSTYNDGSFSWYIPSTQALGSDYKVRITSTSNSAITDQSNNNFAIISTNPTVTVVSPNGGENWIKGTTKQIKWSYTGNPGSYVKIELLKGGYLNKVLTYSTSISPGYYNWYIPTTQTLGSDYKIRVTSTSNSAYTDKSNNNFIISGPTTSSITVISPNGGESWSRGSTKLITWTYSGSPGTNVKIDLYKGGIYKTTISSTTANDGSFSWYIPWSLAIGSDYKIKITSTSNSAYTDTSNNNFRIY